MFVDNVVENHQTEVRHAQIVDVGESQGDQYSTSSQFLRIWLYSTARVASRLVDTRQNARSVSVCIVCDVHIGVYSCCKAAIIAIFNHGSSDQPRKRVFPTHHRQQVLNSELHSTNNIRPNHVLKNADYERKWRKRLWILNGTSKQFIRVTMCAVRQRRCPSFGAQMKSIPNEIVRCLSEGFQFRNG